MSLAQTVLSNVDTLKKAFNVIAALQLTASLFPYDTCLRDGATYDYIIVGGGTSGCVIANRLTEDQDVTVLLLEAGGDTPIEDMYPGIMLLSNKYPQIWPYNTENSEKIDQCHQHPHLRVGVGKMLGGSSSLFYQFYQRGHRSDYDSWARIVNDTTWSSDNVLPYFVKSEYLQDEAIRQSPAGKYHGYDGYLGVSTTRRVGHKHSYDYLKGFEQVGKPTVLDLNTIDSVGYSYLMITAANRTRQSAALSFLAPIKHRNNLFVARYATATKIFFDRNKKAVGVMVTTNNNETVTLKARRELIIAAGTINSAKLLMLSGVGPKTHLKSKGIDVIADLPVGQNLRDHVASIVGIVFTKMIIKKKPQPRDYGEYTAPASYGLLSLSNCSKFPEYQANTYYDDNPIVSFRYCMSEYRLKLEICEHLFKEDVGMISLFNVITHLAPKSVGSVSLRSCDPQETPLINLNYLCDPDDVRKLAMFVQDFVQVLNSPYFKKVGAKMVDIVGSRCDKYVKYSLEYWECYVSCIFAAVGDYVGTCALGSVVDGSVRCEGSEGR